MSILSKNSSVLIATFSPWIKGKRLSINGSLDPMIDFFPKYVKKTVLIDQYYPGSDDVLYRIEIHTQKKVVYMSPVKGLRIFEPILRAKNTPGTHILFKLRDFISVFDCGLRVREKYDYFIGFEAVNAIAGVVLKKIGRVKKVVYYVSDYSPNRYPQRWFNTLYLYLDRFAASHADVIWDVSKAMQPARIKAGLNPNDSAPVIHVPNGLYPYQIKQGDLNQVIPYSLVFLGTLGIENGPDLAIEALPLILKKFPKTTLHIIGGGSPDLKRLQKLVKKYKIEKQVTFHGFISDRKELSDILQRMAIALAPYLSIPGSARWYGDATKIRAYMASGLPTITTHVPPLGKDVKKHNAALVVKDTSKDIAQAVIKVFSDEELFFTLRRNAIDFAIDNTWDNEFKKAFQEMKKYEYYSKEINAKK